MTPRIEAHCEVAAGMALTWPDLGAIDLGPSLALRSMVSRIVYPEHDHLL
jgi:hypothetical protein